MNKQNEIERDNEIKRIRNILEIIGLQFANSVATALVDKNIGTAKRFEVVSIGIGLEWSDTIEPIDYTKEND